MERKLKVLMFGWEFPPEITGGLGVACHGLTKSLTGQGVDITFVLPRPMEVPVERTTFYFHNNTKTAQSINQFSTKEEVGTELITRSTHSTMQMVSVNLDVNPYQTNTVNVFEKSINSGIAKSFSSKTSHKNHSDSSSETFTLSQPKTIEEAVENYSHIADTLVNDVEFDIIHAHDWLTLPAAMRAKELSGKPLVVHIHATEVDRSPGYGNAFIFDIEKKGMEYADQIICVSELTKKNVIEYFDIDPNKISVVYNGMTEALSDFDMQSQESLMEISTLKALGYNIVLFVGRLTYQKGVKYLLEAAKKVVEQFPKALFMIVGKGDMEKELIQYAAKHRISSNIIFTGALSGNAIYQAYAMADVFIMPSVSEPFGIVALEAITSDTPLVISQNSGASEVIDHAFKMDFWNVDTTAEHVINLLSYPSLRETISMHAKEQTKNLTWDKAAQEVQSIYQQHLSI